jgi:hypothetical protein
MKWQEQQEQLIKLMREQGGTVLINLEIFDEYMEQFRQKRVPMKHPLFSDNKGGEDK